MSAKHRLVVISADKNTDYCYLDMSRDEAIERFKKHEDWINIYEAQGIDALFIKELEFENEFMMWRNQGEDIAKHMEEVAPHLAHLFRRD